MIDLQRAPSAPYEITNSLKSILTPGGQFVHLFADNRKMKCCDDIFYLGQVTKNVQANRFYGPYCSVKVL